MLSVMPSMYISTSTAVFLVAPSGFMRLKRKIVGFGSKKTFYLTLVCVIEGGMFSE